MPELHSPFTLGPLTLPYGTGTTAGTTDMLYGRFRVTNVLLAADGPTAGAIAYFEINSYPILYVVQDAAASPASASFKTDFCLFGGDLYGLGTVNCSGVLFLGGEYMTVGAD